MLYIRQAFWYTLALIPLISFGGAQSTTATGTSTSNTTSSSASKTTSTGKATHTVQVGPKTSPHAYVPHSVTANIGDVIVFEFYPTNHSVVKADFDAPCVPATDGLFYSGIFNDFNDNGGDLIGPVSQ